MIRVSFITWQFVRLMARLEETRDHSSARTRLYANWRQDWEQLDKELARTQFDRFGDYAALMMEHTVTFDDVAVEDLATAIDVIEDVAIQIGDSEAQEKGAEVDDLDYEAAELKILAADIRRILAHAESQR